MSYVTDTFASCLTHPFPSEGDIACDNDSSNLYVNPLDGSGGGGAGGSTVSADYSGVRKSASGDGSVLCAKGSQGEGSPRGSRASLALAGPGVPPSVVAGAPRSIDASRTSLPQTIEETVDTPGLTRDDSKPKHRKARFQQASLPGYRHQKLLMFFYFPRARRNEVSYPHFCCLWCLHGIAWNWVSKCLACFRKTSVSSKNWYFMFSGLVGRREEAAERDSNEDNQPSQPLRYDYVPKSNYFVSS